MSTKKTHIGYTFLRRIMHATFPWAYRKIEIIGREKIPTDGAIIFGANHSNGLMDALALIYMTNAPVSFVARADIFRNVKIAKILRFIKISPIMRPRDGRENMAQNDTIMQQSVDVLAQRTQFCIMPEGTHRTMHSQLPLVKGIFRIALMAVEKLDIPVYIVPVGLEYGSHYRYRSTLLMTVGDPIEVRSFTAQYPGMDNVEVINPLREELAKRLSEVHLNIPEKPYYQGLLECCYVSASDAMLGENKKLTLKSRLAADQQILNRLTAWQTTEPKASDIFLKTANEVAKKRRDAGICADALANSNKRFLRIIIRTILLLIGFPYALLATITTAPVWILSEFICKRIDDDAMKNSLRYVIGLFLFSFIYLIIIILLLITSPWFFTYIAIFLLLPMHIFIYDYAHQCHCLYSDIKLMINRSLRKELEMLRMQIMALIKH